MAGRSRIFLPRDFKGLLAVSTKNGKCTLGADLKKKAVRVPSRYGEMLEAGKIFEACSCVDPMTGDIDTELSNGVDVWYEINGGGPSTATVDTKNGNVWVGFVRVEKDSVWADVVCEEKETSCWAICSTM